MDVPLKQSRWLFLAGVLFVGVTSASCELLVPESLPPPPCAGMCAAPTICDAQLNRCVFPEDAGADTGSPDATVGDAATDTTGPYSDGASGDATVTDATLDAQMGDARSDAQFVADATSPLDSGDAAPDAAGDAGDAGDANPGLQDSSIPTLANGAKCDGDQSCASGICGDTSVLPPSLLAAAGGYICTSPCCTSDDCSADEVCYGGATGGNYCIPAAILGRSDGGGEQHAGTRCELSSQCRSGLCSGGHCADTCCDSTACGQSGTVCAFGAFPGAVAWDTAPTFACVADAGTTACGGQQRGCNTNLCLDAVSPLFFGCAEPCRANADCPSAECMFGAVAVADAGVPSLVSVCAPNNQVFPGLGTGESCKHGIDCDSYVCGFVGDGGAVCAVTCFSNDDCTDAGLPGYACQPALSLDTYGLVGGQSAPYDPSLCVAP